MICLKFYRCPFSRTGKCPDGFLAKLEYRWLELGLKAWLNYLRLRLRNYYLNSISLECALLDTVIVKRFDDKVMGTCDEI